MNISDKIRLLEKLAQNQPSPQEMAPPEMAAPPQEAMAPSPEEMPGGDPEGAVDKIKMLIETLNGAGEDAARFDAGNSAAGTRLRKKALEAAKHLKSLRAEVQGVKHSRKNEKAQMVMEAMQQQQAAAQQQAAMEQAQNKAPADELFNPGQPPQQPMMPPQGAMPQEQPKMASALDLEKKANILKLLKGLPGRTKTYLFGGPKPGGQMMFGGGQEKIPGLLNKSMGDLTVGDKILALGGGAAALTAGIRGTDAIIDGVRDPFQKKRALGKMLSENPSLMKEDQGDVSKVFNTLYRFNPTMAKDPLVAGSFMRRSMQYKDEGIQPQDVKTLAEIGKLQADTKKKESLLQAMMGASVGG